MYFHAVTGMLAGILHVWGSYPGYMLHCFKEHDIAIQMEPKGLRYTLNYYMGYTARYKKKSFDWYREVIRTNGGSLTEDR